MKGGLADARHEIAERHVDDTQAAERRSECDDARLLRRRAADAASIPAAVSVNPVNNSFFIFPLSSLMSFSFYLK